MKVRPLICIGGMVALLSASFAAPANANNQTRVNAPPRCSHRNPALGTLVYSEATSPATLNPYHSAFGLHFALFDSLFRIGPKGRAYPMMAAAIPTRKN